VFCGGRVLVAPAFGAAAFVFVLMHFLGVLVVRFRVRVFGRGLVRGGGTVDLAGILCAWGPIHSVVFYWRREGDPNLASLADLAHFVLSFHGSTNSVAGFCACLRLGSAFLQIIS
jgi:hypothetical protein